MFLCSLGREVISSNGPIGTSTEAACRCWRKGYKGRKRRSVSFLVLEMLVWNSVNLLSMISVTMNRWSKKFNELKYWFGSPFRTKFVYSPCTSRTSAWTEGVLTTTTSSTTSSYCSACDQVTWFRFGRTKWIIVNYVSYIATVFASAILVGRNHLDFP